MGIERFFSTVEHGTLTHNTVLLIEKPVRGDHLMIDYNSIIHVTSQRVLKDLNMLLYAFLKRETGTIEKLTKKYQLEIRELNEFQLWVAKPENLDSVILEAVIKETVHLTQKLSDVRHLKSLYLAIDGVPSKGKIEEQKKRRYMGSVISHFKQEMFKKYEKEIAKDEIRYQYEQHKISWSKSLITPGTEFMDRLYHRLIHRDLIKQFQDLCPQLKDYRVSGPYEPGEGEKKIVNFVYQYPQPKDKYLIYSPDADVTLLALLLTVKRKSFPGIPQMMVLRHNQQTGDDNLIDTQLLGKNIYEFIRKQVPRMDYDRVINEVVFIFTVFGNDFLPKIESFNVKNDFEFILQRYIDLLQKVPDAILIKEVGEKVHLNLDVLKLLFKSLHYDEGGQLQKSYLFNKYKNIGWFKKLLGADQHTLLRKMGDFLKQMKELTKNLEEGYTPRLEKRTRNILQKLLRAKPNTDDRRLIQMIQSNPQRLKDELKLRSFQRSIRDRFHREKMEASMAQHPKITDYDQEMYQFENMLDNYREKLSARPIDLGRIWINHKSWSWEAEKIETGVERYYYNYFGIHKMNQSRLDYLMYQYVLGIYWVFNYYYNAYDDRIWQTGSIWYFPYHKSPLMTQLYQYLNRNASVDLMPKILEDLKRYRVPRLDYFNCIEHLMYVTPAKMMIDLIPKEYQKFVQESDYYPDLKKLVADFRAGKESIDCRGVIFLNKCHLKIEKPRMKDADFIKALRKIPVSDSVRQRMGKMGGDMEIFTFQVRK